MPKSKTPKRKATSMKNISLSSAQLARIAEHYASSVASVRRDPKPSPAFKRTGYDRVELVCTLDKDSNDKRGDLLAAVREGSTAGHVRFRPGQYRVIVERVWNLGDTEEV